MTEVDILVVCMGNVCRSPLAERLLRHRFEALLGSSARAVSVSSAGVTALAGSAMDPYAAAELRRLGGDPDGFVARQWRPEMAGDADLVLTATREVRTRVLEEAPRALKRTFTIREMATLATSLTGSEHPIGDPADMIDRAAAWRSDAAIEDYDVPDPIGGPPDVHRQVADLLDRNCSAIVRAVVAALVSDVRTV